MCVMQEPEVLEALRAVGASVSEVSTENGTLKLNAAAREGGRWNLEICVPIPLTNMPKVFLANAEDGFGLAHVDHKGEVCYSDQEGESYDPTDLARVTAFAFQRACSVLEEASKKRSKRDFRALTDEFEGYWQSIPGCHRANLTAPPVSDRALYGQVNKDNRPGLGKVSLRLLALNYGSPKDQKAPNRKAHYFPLFSPILPPKNSQAISNEWLIYLIKEGGIEAQKESVKKGLHIFLFSQPRSEGLSLFGVLFETKILGKNKKEFRSITPFTVQRCWRDYLLERTGQISARHHVAVIGCGAVGGRVAEHLAMSGVDELTLVDDDVFTYDNIYRHVLGEGSAGTNKSKALRRYLSSKCPGLKITAEPVSAETWLSRTTQVNNCDTLVLTTGKPGLERHINREAFANRWPHRLISGWLEPLGLGGHVMVSQYGQAGCLECLYSDWGGSDPSMRVSFLKPGQSVSRNITGCGGRFMPYSSIHAARTALLICEAALGQKSGYSCWAGDASSSRSEGLELTSWYERCREGKPSGDVAHEACPCCSS